MSAETKSTRRAAKKLRAVEVIAPGPRRLNNTFAWSPEEDRAVALLAPKRGGVDRLQLMLPHRPRAMITKRARALGAPCHETWNPWTKEEDRILLREWGEVLPRRLREFLPGRSWQGIVHRAQRLGLAQGIPQGWETRARAAERVGMDWHTFVRLLDKHKVTTRLHRTARSGSKCRYVIVETDAVDAAVAAEMREWETVAPAARARGVSPTSLLKWLREAGEIPPRGEGPKKVLRVRSEVIDRVVAEGRASWTPGVEAYRARMNARAQARRAKKARARRV